MGRQKQFVVVLTADKQQRLTDMTRKGVQSARVMTRARLLLLSEQGLKDREVAERVGVSTVTVASIRRKFVEISAQTGTQTGCPRHRRPDRRGVLDA